MDNTVSRSGVWFVYDGDCPVCTMAAQALRIQERHGPLHLVNARDESDSPLLQEIKRRHLDLDDGMVILCDGRFYHGKDALRFMAQHGDTRGWFNQINRTLFNSEALSRVSYPWMRAIRNLLLRVRGVSKLDNLRNADEPVFKRVFGKDWDQLPPVLQRHYSNRPFKNDVVTVEGRLKVEASPLGRMLRPAFRLTKTLVPYEGENIPVTVHFTTDTRSTAFRFDRTFHFPGQAPYHFRSAMIPVRDNELIEMMGLGVGWRMAYAWTGTKVVLSHKGYALRLFGVLIPLPLGLLIGKGYAEEILQSADTFSMMTEIRHPLWGKVFGYSGTFRVTKDR